MTALEAKVDLIMSSLGIGSGKVPQLQQQRGGGRLPAGEFKSPRIRAPKAEGRNERLVSIFMVLQSQSSQAVTT